MGICTLKSEVVGAGRVIPGVHFDLLSVSVAVSVKVAAP